MLLTAVPSMGQNTPSLENINQALRYSRYSRISPKIIPVSRGDRDFRLQMVVEKIEEDPDFNDYEFYYAILYSFSEEIGEVNLIRLNESDLRFDTDRHYYFEKNIQIPEDRKTAFALMKVKDIRQGDEYYFHTDLISPFVETLPEFGAYFGNDVPFDQNFLNSGDALIFKGGRNVSLHHFYYPQQFNVPLPPMETKPAAVPREITVEDEGSFLINVPKTFEKEGYYFIQADTTKSTGMVVKTTSEAYPRVKDWEQMIEMVVYISTRKEHETLMNAEDKKKALDQYWISVTKDEATSKELIREYFRQIEFANILFTDFRDGWKTDRGMVYTVMGPPLEVYFQMEREIWIYPVMDSNSKLTFTFARVRNIFTSDYYTLNRSRAYQPEWFKKITTWRSGRMVF
nr:GWxTD domain-containing protein [Pararhodonellum marinum]